MGVVDHLISLQSLDRCMNGYLKQRSKGHMFTVISNATDLALERYIDLAERKARRVYFSAARRTAMEACAEAYFDARHKPKKLAA